MGKIARKVKHPDVILVVISIFVVVLVSVMSVIFSTHSASEIRRLQAEVQRVTDASGVKPISISCRNTNIADICFVNYDLSDNAVSKMLEAANYSEGYKTPSPYPYPDSTVFENEQKLVRVTLQGDSDDTTAILRYLDIRIRI